jgi:hypothetical protein
VLVGAFLAGAIFMLADDVIPWQIGVIVVPIMLARADRERAAMVGAARLGAVAPVRARRGALLTYTWHAFTMGSVKGRQPHHRSGQPRHLRGGRGRHPRCRGAAV